MSALTDTLERYAAIKHEHLTDEQRTPSPRQTTVDDIATLQSTLPPGVDAQELYDLGVAHADLVLRDLAKAGRLRGANRGTLRAVLIAVWLDAAGFGMHHNAPRVDAALVDVGAPSDALKAALESVAHLGAGGAGPWENRSHVLKRHMPSYPVVDAWVNATYSVQLLQHPTHPGIDHLLIRRHDEGTAFAWQDLQRIKDRLAPGGQGRWAWEAFPARAAVVDNENLRHVWVMPVGWAPPVDLRDVRT